MEQSTEFDLEFELQGFLNSVNPDGVLSDIDQDELRDHLYLDIESLEHSGLTTEEAFIISQKRFGNTELIHEEYRKANPQKRIIQYLVSAVALIFGVKMIFNLMTISSFSTLMVVKSFANSKLDFYLTWGDLGVQVFTLLISLIAGVFIFKKIFSGKIKSLWPIPVSFLLSEVIYRLMYSFTLPVIAPDLIGNTHFNHTLIVLSVTILSVFASFWMIFTHRNLKLKFD